VASTKQTLSNTTAPTIRDSITYNGNGGSLQSSASKQAYIRPGSAQPLNMGSPSKSAGAFNVDYYLNGKTQESRQQ